VCGWFAAGKTCNACGTEPGHTAATQDHQAVSLFAGPRPEDFPHLRSAFAAWRNKDWTRMVGQCLECLGVERQTVVRRDEGPGWTFVQDSAAIYLRIDEQAEALSVDAPMVWMPRTQRVPLMRALLELNGSALGIARFCVREDRVVLRFSDTLANLNPPKLVQAIAEVAVLADRYDDLLAAMFAAAMIGPTAQARNMDWSFLGTPRRLAVLADMPGRDTGGSGSSSSWGSFTSSDSAPAPEPRSEVDVRLAAAEAMTELLRESAQIADFLRYSDEDDVHFVLAQRALIYRTCHEYGDSCLGAVAHLLRHAGQIGAHLFASPPPGRGQALKRTRKDVDLTDRLMPAALAIAVATEHLIDRGSIVEEMGKARVEPFESRVEALRHFRNALEYVRSGPAHTEYCCFVLTGMLAEMRLRVDMPPKMATNIDRALKVTSQHPPHPETVTQLIKLLERVLR